MRCGGQTHELDVGQTEIASPKPSGSDCNRHFPSDLNRISALSSMVCMFWHDPCPHLGTHVRHFPLPGMGPGPVPHPSCLVLLILWCLSSSVEDTHFICPRCKFPLINSLIARLEWPASFFSSFLPITQEGRFPDLGLSPGSVCTNTRELKFKFTHLAKWQSWGLKLHQM